jgi:molecular chaperone GrpE (heat shock protein)
VVDGKRALLGSLLLVELCRRRIGGLTAQDDISAVAAQLADLTRTVREMESQLVALRERADVQQERAESQRERTEIQQERIDLAARELAEVSERLQAAADALRESI